MEMDAESFNGLNELFMYVLYAKLYVYKKIELKIKNY
jgi:hypothetical protein